jgi:hypothetical protein
VPLAIDIGRQTANISFTIGSARCG